MAITPIFADAINLPIVFILGIAVLVPLMAFEVLVEAFILGRHWKLPSRQLWAAAFFANCWSLAAGIPVKIANSYLYAQILPKDFPSYFRAYPVVMTIGSFLYFAVTIAVEGLYAKGWRTRKNLPISTPSVWRAIFIANLATYIVLAPLHYFLTRPTNPDIQFTDNANWSAHPKSKVIFVDPKTSHLIATHIDGSNRETVIPAPVRDYIVSSNLDLSLYRSADNNLYFRRRTRDKTIRIWQTTERFRMDQVAFSPSGHKVAYISPAENTLVTLDTENFKRAQTSIEKASAYDEPSIVWSTNETTFYFIRKNGTNAYVADLQNDDQLQIKPTSPTAPYELLPVYGRATGSSWGGGGDWGQFFSMDQCNNLSISAQSGLASHLRIEDQNATSRSAISSFGVNPGLLHLFGFDFQDVSFLPNCQETIFDTAGYIYVWNYQQKKIGMVTAGERFILLTDRYRKTLHTHEQSR